jgi:hypothetical protein
MNVLGVAAIWAVLLAAGILAGVALPRRRTRHLQREARRLDLQFAPTAKPFRGTRVESLALLDDGAETEVENLLQSSDPTSSILVFDLGQAEDYSYLVTTYAAFRSPIGDLPPFHIGSRDVLERLEEAFGKKTLKIDCDADFSSHFYVQCDDERETRHFLSMRDLRPLCAHPGHCHIQTSPDWLLVYRPGVKVAAAHVDAFIAEANEIAQALLNGQPRNLPLSA